jgi:DHA2 family multidrug resistance protein
VNAGGGSDVPKVRPRVNHWVIALTVTLATFMEVLDTSIANVALPHIAGGLGAARTQSTWVLTSYLVANAIVLPLSGWLIGLFGRKRFYMTCVFLFTVSSALCGAAPNLEMLIFFRVLQGIGGGGLQPTEQGILVDTFPKQQFGMAMAIYGVAVVVAPILGPTLGGWITDNYSWRWIFYINVPIGCISLVLTHFLIDDPPGMAEQIKANRKRGIKVDYLGLSFVTLGLGSLEVIYAKGQELDWLGSNMIVTFMIIAAVSLVALVIWELRHPEPIINFRLLWDRNFLACGLMMYFIFAVLYGSNANLPQMLQELYGYDAINAGLILSPAAFFTMMTMPIVGFLLGKKVDARFLIPIGLAITAISCYWQAHLNFQASPIVLISVRCVTMFGLGFLFVPVNNAAYLYISKSQTNNATGLFNLIRNEGGSLGIAIGTTMVERRAQFHQLRLAEHIRPANLEVQQMIRTLGNRITESIGAAHVEASVQGYSYLYRMVVRQARLMAYLDVFWIFWIMTLATFPLLLLMKRSVAEGDTVAAH